MSIVSFVWLSAFYAGAFRQNLNTGQYPQPSGLRFYLESIRLGNSERQRTATNQSGALFAMLVCAVHRAASSLAAHLYAARACLRHRPLLAIVSHAGTCLYRAIKKGWYRHVPPFWFTMPKSNTGEVLFAPRPRWHREKGATPCKALSDNPQQPNYWSASLNLSDDLPKSSAPATPSTLAQLASRSASAGDTNSSQHLRNRACSSTSPHTTAQPARRSHAATTARRNLSAQHSSLRGCLNRKGAIGAVTNSSTDSCSNCLSSTAQSFGIMGNYGHGPMEPGQSNGASLRARLSVTYPAKRTPVNRPARPTCDAACQCHPRFSESDATNNRHTISDGKTKQASLQLACFKSFLNAGGVRGSVNATRWRTARQRALDLSRERQRIFLT